ncbi:MAG: ABC transporter permease subunit [Anaerohalosphaeraceae bacterium]
MNLAIQAVSALTAKLDYLADKVGFYRVVGPILDKELRVTSRRKRYYFLRTGYIVLLILILAQVWFFAVLGSSSSGANLYQASRMSQVALTTTMTIFWFEFIVLQLLAVVMLSSAVSDEIRKNTLDSLLSSPITAIQIVLGKLFARLWQLILLAGISMPILSILRSMGGVPWDFLLAGTCITITAAMTAGLISLWYSISRRPAYQVIYLTLLTCLLLYGASPLLLTGLNGLPVQIPEFEAVLVLLNPFVAFTVVSKSLLGAQSSASAVYPWPVHCLSMLGFCIVLMGLCIRKVRTVMSRHRVSIAQRWRQRLCSQPSQTCSEDTIPLIQFPEGMNPVTRKELSRAGLWGFGQRWMKMALLLGICCLYGSVAYCGWLREKGFHIAVIELLILWAMLQVMSLSARSIVVEKEGRTWISLLTTPLDDQQILMGKVWAVIRRTMPVWLWIGIHLIVFSAAGVLSPLSLLTVPLELAGSVYFLLGMGMYFSARLKSSTAAVAATFALPISLSFICPCIAYMNPLVIVPAVMNTEFNEIVMGVGLFWFVRLIIITCMGMTFLSSAEKRIRGKVFDMP